MIDTVIWSYVFTEEMGEPWILYASKYKSVISHDKDLKR